MQIHGVELGLPVESAPDDEVDIPSPSMLLVDDRAANLLALEGVLEPLGYRMVRASSGEEALKRILAEDFALILMDVRMPGLDGFHTVALIKQREKNIHVPVIFVSAVAKEAEEISKGYAYGAVDYIVKPFDPEILRAKVSVLMALHLQAERIARQRELLAERRHQLQRQSAERAEAERATRLKDEFLAFVSHELRTPLSVIVGWTELLASGSLDAERTRTAIETIRRNAELQTLLVEDLIALSQMVLGNVRLHRERVDLQHVVLGCIDSLKPIADDKRIRLSYRAEVGDGGCYADPQRLHQVICNLLSNSLKFTNPGGEIAVSLRDDAGRLRIDVIDNGVGIKPEALPNVFRRFWQDRTLPASTSGLGLGLAVVQQLVELHGGNVTVDSDGDGRGTRVAVLLPRG